MIAEKTVQLSPEEEQLLIQRAYRTLLRSMKTDMSPEDSHNIRMAYEIAVEAHSKQKRKSGEPYILHPIEVARICAAELGLGPTAVVAALLHDVVEDTDVTVEQIKEKFGTKIAKIVDGLTKLDNVSNSESPQAENFKKVLSSLVDDVRTVLIKMADRLHNMRTLGAMPRHKQLKIAAETNYIYAPLAHRLGLYAIKTEFQDLTMRITDTEVYSEIQNKLKETQTDRDKYIEYFIQPLKEALKEFDYTYTIFGRPKSTYSIWNKMKSKGVPFESIYDLFAIRIIVDAPPKKEKSACWEAFSIVTDIYTPIAERMKDFISRPKANGYKSLHTTVVGPQGKYVEVQIRSNQMDEIAEKGYAAHWKYKGIQTSNGQPDVFNEWLDNVRELLDNDGSDDAIEFIHNFKSNLVNEEVYVYTPNGDMKILPKGATALDFAFMIHTDIGYHCAAIKVNDKLMPMGYKLVTGDQVQIITNKNQKPAESWLKYVVTGSARSKIRVALKEDKKKLGIFGKETLERKFDHLKVNFIEENVDIIMRFCGHTNRLDFYYDISNEKIDVTDKLRNFKVEGGKLLPIEVAPTVKKDWGGLTKDDLKKRQLEYEKHKEYSANLALYINGELANEFEYKLSSCCSPIQGDEIFAFVGINGLKIHRTTCSNAMHMMAKYSAKVLKAEWKEAAKTTFQTELEITGIDPGPGMIEKISSTISALGLNIVSMNIAAKEEGHFECLITLEVTHTNQIEAAINKLKTLQSVSNVERVVKRKNRVKRNKNNS